MTLRNKDYWTGYKEGLNHILEKIINMAIDERKERVEREKADKEDLEKNPKESTLK